jgi:hypothetical protein
MGECELAVQHLKKEQAKGVDIAGSGPLGLHTDLTYAKEWQMGEQSGDRWGSGRWVPGDGENWVSGDK